MATNLHRRFSLYLSAQSNLFRFYQSLAIIFWVFLTYLGPHYSHRISFPLTWNISWNLQFHRCRGSGPFPSPRTAATMVAAAVAASALCGGKWYHWVLTPQTQSLELAGRSYKMLKLLCQCFIRHKRLDTHVIQLARTAKGEPWINSSFIEIPLSISWKTNSGCLTEDTIPAESSQQSSPKLLIVNQIHRNKFTKKKKKKCNQ